MDGDGCFAPSTRPLTVDGDEVIVVALDRAVDGFGYSCEVVDEDYVEAGTVVPLAGDDVSTTIDLPFSFSFYGQSYASAHVASNGYLNFETRNASYANTALPNTDAPNAAVYPFWDDFNMEGAASVRTETIGTAPSRRFVMSGATLRSSTRPTRSTSRSSCTRTAGSSPTIATWAPTAASKGTRRPWDSRTRAGRSRCSSRSTSRSCAISARFSSGRRADQTASCCREAHGCERAAALRRPAPSLYRTGAWSAPLTGSW